MSDTVLAALITAIATVIVAIVSTVRHVLPTPVRRRGNPAAFAGLWEGVSTETQSAGPREATITVQAKTRLRTVQAEMTLRRDGGTYSLRGKGWVLPGRVLCFVYETPRKHARNYGAAFLELDDSGDELTGHFLGWGMEARDWIRGDLSLKRLG